MNQIELINLFTRRTGYAPNLDDPQSYCEKCLWKKFYVRDPRMVQYGDKFRAKELIAGKSEALPLPDPDPGQWPVMAKLNCASGAFRIVNNEQEFRQFVRQYGGAPVYGAVKGEWHYGQMKPVIYCERVLTGFTELKFFCFDGRARCAYKLTEKPRTRTYYSLNGEKLDVQEGYLDRRFDNCGKPIPSDVDIGRMRKAAEQLSAGFDHVRVDLIWHQGKIYFTEFTFFNYSGMIEYRPKSFDYELGSHWKLSEDGR